MLVGSSVCLQHNENLNNFSKFGQIREIDISTKAQGQAGHLLVHLPPENKKEGYEITVGICYRSKESTTYGQTLNQLEQQLSLCLLALYSADLISLLSTPNSTFYSTSAP